MYYSTIKEAFKKFVIPYHVSKLFHGTNRFLALPETVISPQIIFLPLMKIKDFVFFNTLLLYCVGFLGCLLIREKYKLSLLPFSSLFLLFNFNGYITSHLAVGHSAWNGYFFLPFFSLFLLELIEGAPSTNPIKLSFVLFAIVLQGAFHLYVWCLMFLLLLAVFNTKYLKQILLTTLFSVLLSFFRLLPAALSSLHDSPPFISGYPTIRVLFDAFTLTRGHTYPWLGGIFGSMKWWEYDIYMGVLGFGLLLYFGIYLRFKEEKELSCFRYKALDMPLFVLSVLSLSYFYFFIAIFIKVERVSSRFLIVPVIILLVISCIRMQQILFRFSKNTALLAVGAVEMFFALISHSYIWRIYEVEKFFKGNTPDLGIKIIQQKDVIYKLSVIFSTFISLAAFSILLYFLLVKLKSAVQLGITPK